MKMKAARRSQEEPFLAAKTGRKREHLMWRVTAQAGYFYSATSTQWTQGAPSPDSAGWRQVGGGCSGPRQPSGSLLERLGGRPRGNGKAIPLKLAVSVGGRPGWRRAF